MGKKTVYKGVLNGIATSYYNRNIVIKLEDKIEEIPEEIVIYPRIRGTRAFKAASKPRQIFAFTARPGDKISVEGELILETDNNLEYYRMPCKHIYNVTLKVGL